MIISKGYKNFIVSQYIIPLSGKIYCRQSRQGSNQQSNESKTETIPLMKTDKEIIVSNDFSQRQREKKQPTYIVYAYLYFYIYYI
jgi:hypothetical protein